MGNLFAGIFNFIFKAGIALLAAFGLFKGAEWLSEQGDGGVSNKVKNGAGNAVDKVRDGAGAVKTHFVDAGNKVKGWLGGNSGKKGLHVLPEEEVQEWLAENKGHHVNFGPPLKRSLVVTDIFDKVNPKIRKHAHDAVDFKGAKGEPVISQEIAIVDKVDNAGKGGAGFYVSLRYPDGTRTVSAHLDSIDVTVGQKLPKGYQIGAVGNTGTTTSHLHLKVINPKGRVVDPMEHMPTLQVATYKDTKDKPKQYVNTLKGKPHNHDHDVDGSKVGRITPNAPAKEVTLGGDKVMTPTG